MNVLICDDDVSSRIIVKKVLTRDFHCRVAEASNGLEALDAMEAEHFDIVILDLDMPVMNGVEVLRAVRASAHLATTPVLVFSSETEDTAIRELVRLGASGIVIKPFNQERFVARFTPLLSQARTSPAVSQAQRRVSLGLQPNSTALIVDGDADYRQYFAKAVGARCELTEAESGSRALQMCLASPPDMLFIGIDLGLLGGPQLVEQVRAIQAKAVQIVGIPLKSEAAAARASGMFDEVLLRTYVPTSFEREIARLLQPLTAWDRLCQQVPDIRSRLLRVAEQVFGLMLATDVESVEAPPPPTEPRASAAVRITTDEFIATVRLRFDTQSGRAIAAAFLASDANGLAEGDIVAASGEVANVLAGRLQACFEEHKLSPSIDPPVLGTEPTAGDQQSIPSDLSLHFKAVDTPVAFEVDLLVEAPANVSTGRATGDEEGRVTTLPADTEERLEQG